MTAPKRAAAPGATGTGATQEGSLLESINSPFLTAHSELTRLAKVGSVFVDDVLDMVAVRAVADAVRKNPRWASSAESILRDGGLSDGDVAAFKAAVLRRTNRSGAVEIVRASDLLLLPDPQFLIEDFLELGGMTLVHGPPKEGKTFVVFSMAYCIARGTPWFGHEVQSGPVVYVAAEGYRGLGVRLQALMLSEGSKVSPADLHIVGRAVNVCDYESVLDLVEAIQELRFTPKLVVIDTYARSMLGADENSARDTGTAVAHLDMLRGRLDDCGVLIVHHSVKGKGGERGSGALAGAVDTKLKLERRNGIISLISEMQKDFPPAHTLRLQLQPMGNSAVPTVAGSATQTGSIPPGPPGIESRENVMASELLDALKEAQSRGQTPIAQTALLKKVRGNAAEKASVLHRLAEDSESPVVMEERGNAKLYDLESDS